ncbi:MAG: thioredoxin family protein [Alphaproteobacteria bacterium]|nr:thioredoxin family protein [Alphaproteobacteria bacterium]MDE2336268.1 thioredoxin family protein [Alphaproteobacteria bacterium]
MTFRFFAPLLAALLFMTPAPVRAQTAQAATAPRLQAQLIAAVTGTGDLKTIQAGVEIKLAQGWHTYWRTPGETGLAPAFDWAGSQNLRSADILWPAPTRYDSFGIQDFGYKNAVVFPVTVTPRQPGDAVVLHLKLNVLVCKELCVPAQQTLTLKIPAGEAEVSAEQPLLAAALKEIPSQAGNGAFSVSNVWLDDSGKKLSFHAYGHAAAPPAADADLFIESKSGASFGAPRFAYNPATQELEITAPVRGGGALSSLESALDGTDVTLTYKSNGAAWQRSVTFGGAHPAHRVMENLLQGAAMHLDPAILLFAFLGGLILNLMPCVLPVLSIKVLEVLSHGGKDHRLHRAEIFRNFMAAAAGIVFSFWAVAGGLVLVKDSGAAIGWGIQFQYPPFLIFLIAVLLVFAANMWGFFEIPLPRFVAHHLTRRHEHAPTMLGHFLTGAFATLLATPCSAPFLGTAISFALARQAADIFTVFTFMGLGLAAPYILLALSPRVFKYMPKPGNWMLAFKKILAAALFLTALWLGHVLLTIETQPTLDAGWQPFDQTQISRDVAQGDTVFVDITADWCLTCKANMRLVLDRPDVEAAMAVPNVVLMQGDWTHHDARISAYLNAYGRYGIPFNIVYGPGAPNGIILSELLSKREVLNALIVAAGE